MLHLLPNFAKWQYFHSWQLQTESTVQVEILNTQVTGDKLNRGACDNAGPLHVGLRSSGVTSHNSALFYVLLNTM